MNIPSLPDNKNIASKKPIIIGKRESQLAKVVPLLSQAEIEFIKLIVNIINKKVLS